MKISTARVGIWRTGSKNSNWGYLPIEPRRPGCTSNQLRLYFSSFAYILIQTLRRLGLQGTELAQAQCDTIRLKLFKIGAQIQVTVRKVWISFSESYPYLSLFQKVLARLQQIPSGG